MINFSKRFILQQLTVSNQAKMNEIMTAKKIKKIL